MIEKEDKKMIKNIEIASKIVLKEDEELFKKLAKEKGGEDD